MGPLNTDCTINTELGRRVTTARWHAWVLARGCRGAHKNPTYDETIRTDHTVVVTPFGARPAHRSSSEQ
jgi:hypothetical protein